MSKTISNDMSMVELESYIETNSNLPTDTLFFTVGGRTFADLNGRKNELLLFAKATYLYNVKANNPDESSSDIFSWYKNAVKVWMVCTNTKSAGTKEIIYFATNDKVESIEIINAIDITSSSNYYNSNKTEKIKFLIDNNIIPDISDDIIYDSINTSGSIKAWAELWVSAESKNIETLIKAPTEIFDFNKSIIRAKRYNFEEMLKVINDDQFTMEFDECLFAYNNQKWFVCAAGLGGILEHLIYLTLDKNNLIDINFPDDATAKIYIEYLSRKPIKMKKREKTHLRSLFLIRNSVSHYNQGFTSKDQCQTLMNGIRDFFNNYYTKDFSLDDN